MQTQRLHRLNILLEIFSLKRICAKSTMVVYNVGSQLETVHTHELRSKFLQWITSESRQWIVVKFTKNPPLLHLTYSSMLILRQNKETLTRLKGTKNGTAGKSGTILDTDRQENIFLCLLTN